MAENRSVELLFTEWPVVHWSKRFATTIFGCCRISIHSFGILVNKNDYFSLDLHLQFNEKLGWLVHKGCFIFIRPPLKTFAKRWAKVFYLIPNTTLSVWQRSNDCAAPECSCQWGIKGPTVTTARVHYTLSSFHLIWLTTACLTACLLLLTNQPTDQPYNHTTLALALANYWWRCHHSTFYFCF